MTESVTVPSQVPDNDSAQGAGQRSAEGLEMKYRLLGAALAVALGIAEAGAQVTVLASVATDGTLGNGDSPENGARISGNGQFATFRSPASNLVFGDTNNATDIFVRNLTAGTTTRISVNNFGVQGNGDSHNPWPTPDGRFVAFTSFADNLLDGAAGKVPHRDLNEFKDVFVRDIQLGITTLVSESAEGEQANGESDSGAISANGQFVAFRSMSNNLAPGDTNGQSDVYLKNLGTGEVTLVSVDTSGFFSGNGKSGFTKPAISADGRYVAFSSSASNLVSGDTNASEDVFVRDIWLGVTSRISVASNGAQGNAKSICSVMSADARYVAFSAVASNLVPGDSNGVFDVFVRDRTAGTTTRVSVDASGRQSNGPSGMDEGWSISISANGQFIAFSSSANNLLGPGKDKNLVDDVFVRDQFANKTAMASVTAAGKPGNGGSGGPSISYVGNVLTVLFHSRANNLVFGDTNGFQDVFVRR